MSNFIIAIWFVLMASALWLAYIVIKNTKAAQLSPRRKRTWAEMNRVFKLGRRNKTNARITRIAHKNPMLAGLWHQLLIRVNFDTPAAERLVEQLRRKHPGQTDRWYIEKAIFDLERDKR
jgi:hypothetical protein